MRKLTDAIRRLLHRQPTVKIGPSITVDWRESTARVLEEQGRAISAGLAEGLKTHERLMKEANLPELPTLRQVISKIVNRYGWTLGGVPLEPLIFNDNGNPWQSIETDVNIDPGNTETIAHMFPFYVALPVGAHIVDIEYKAPDGTWHKLGDWDERGQKALELWRRTLEEFEPHWLLDLKPDKRPVRICLFCGQEEPEKGVGVTHLPDCIYVQAKALFPLEKSGGGADENH